MTHIRSKAIKQRIGRKYNTSVVAWTFKVGDIVLKRAKKHSTDGKLAPNWDGSFRVYESLGNGAYRLVELSKKEIPRTWNVTKLWRYYS